MVTVFALHALGSSARSFEAVAVELAQLEGEDEVRALDLPGFGAAAPRGAATVEQMAGDVAAAIAASGARDWVLAGHSLGGKIATVVAVRALADPQAWPGLRGIALLAASPPGPEPMDEARRSLPAGSATCWRAASP